MGRNRVDVGLNRVERWISGMISATPNGSRWVRLLLGQLLPPFALSLVGCAMIARIVKRLALVCSRSNLSLKRFNETRESKVVIAN